MSFNPDIDVNNVETGDDQLVTLHERLERELGLVGSDFADDEPSTPQSTQSPIKLMKPSSQNYHG